MKLTFIHRVRLLVLMHLVLASLLAACSSDEKVEDDGASDVSEVDGDERDLSDLGDLLPDGDLEEDVEDVDGDASPDLDDGGDSGDNTCGDGTQPCACFPPEVQEQGSNPSCGELTDFSDIADVRTRTECLDANPGAETFSLGFGENSFNRPAEGEIAMPQFVRGGQGGFHIYGSMRFPELDRAASAPPRVRATYWISHCTRCGDGYLDKETEECEIGERGCSDSCEDTCGNGVVEPEFGEECDDGGQTATCDRDCTFVVCGDGRRNIDAGETCEPDSFNAKFCMPTCISRAPGASSACGDGFVYAANEECDDGNLDPNDRCAGCKRTFCGDGVIQTDVETCDDGDDNGQPGKCNFACDGTVSQTCSNGALEAGESCDTSGDSVTCDADCSAASCGDGYVNAAAGEVCDDGDENGAPNFCDENCAGPTAAVCGNGVLEDGENCEDNIAYRRCDENGENCVANINYPACDDDCSIDICGNGEIEGDEDCDVVDPSASCDVDCTDVECGDGVVNRLAGERCDDGDDNGTAGSCNTSCTGPTASVCGNGVRECGEVCDSADGSCTDMCLPTTCVEGSLAQTLSDWQPMQQTADGWQVTGNLVIFESLDLDSVACSFGTLHVLAQLDDCTYYSDSFLVRPQER